MKIIASSDNPVFPGNESARTNRHIGDIEGPQQCRRFVVVDVDFAIVQCAEDPTLGRMEIDGLDAVRSA